jgi:hypothetical protein
MPPMPALLLEVALGQFGNCFEATTWSSREISIAQRRRSDGHPPRGKAAARSIPFEAPGGAGSFPGASYF